MDTEHRCSWAESDPLMRDYHDTEWGVPEHDSRALWEMLMLEGFQAGLAWIIVLRKREAFRTAFAGFDPVKVAKFTEKDILRLMQDEGIVRARAKIEATIKGDGKSFVATTPLSEQISKELKRRGFKFVGPTIVYAWRQAVGIANDHASRCFRRQDVARSSASLGR